jgi:hypothetical protein
VGPISFNPTNSMGSCRDFVTATVSKNKRRYAALRGFSSPFRTVGRDVPIAPPSFRRKRIFWSEGGVPPRE